MVAIVSGDSLGLSLTSLTTLGQEGVAGASATGRNGEQAFVNVATGNLVLHDQDDYLAAQGADISIVRTYNSQGQLQEGDRWALGTTRQRVDRAADGITIVRTDRDNAQATYTWDAVHARYVTTAGGGADDIITWDAASGTCVWTDGATGLREAYDADGRLDYAEDVDLNRVEYTYGANGKLETVTGANGESIRYDYDIDGRLTGITDLLGGATVSKVHYAYTGGRLSEVTVDLDPADPSRTYKTFYAYDADGRIQRMAQTDGTQLTFTYNSDGKVETVTDALLHVTHFKYEAGLTTVTDPVGIATQYRYGASGELKSITTGNVAGVAGSATTSVTTVPVAQVTVTLGTDAQGRGILSWPTPAAGSGSTFRYRPQNPVGAGWVSLTPSTNGATQSVLLPVGATGEFDYELLQAQTGNLVPSGRALGTFTAAQVGSGHYDLQTFQVGEVTVQVTGDTEAATSRMSWPAPAQGTTTTWRYRLAGDPAAQWLALTPQTVGATQSVDLSALAAGAYEFDLLETAQGVPTAHATGTLTVNALVAGSSSSTWSPVNPVTVTTNTAGQAQLNWDAPPAGTTTVASYRTTGGTWQNLTVTVDAATGKQVASLAGIAAGTYEYKMAQTGAATLSASGRVEILPVVAQHTETQPVTIDVLTLTANAGLNWPAAPAGSANSFRYRVLGSGAAWTTYTGATTTTAGTQTLAVALLPLRNQWVEFELLQTPTGGNPAAYAIGAYYTTGSGSPTLKVGQVALAEGSVAVVTGSTPTTRGALVTVPAYVPAREATPVVVAGTNAAGQPQLSWDIPPAGTTATLKYTDAGGVLRTLALTTDAATGKQSASLAGIPAGTYAYELAQTGGFAVRVTGSVQVFAPVAAGSETRQLPIGVMSPVTGGTTGLSWPSGLDGATTTLRYREPGKTSWSTYTNQFVYSNNVKSVAADKLSRNKYIEFEIFETPAGGGNPTSHATGIFFDNGGNTVSVQLGQVALQNNAYVITGPISTTQSVTVSFAAYTPAPVLSGATTFTIPQFKAIPAATNTTSGSVEVSTWVEAPIQVTGSAQGVSTTAGVSTQYYSTAAGIAGLRQIREFQYNDDGDVIAVTNGAAEKNTFEYDARGNLTLQRDHAGNMVTRTYNEQNQLTSETRFTLADAAAGAALQLARDTAVAHTAAGSLTARYVYDPANGNRLRFSVSAQGRVTEYVYNPTTGERTSELTFTAQSYGGAPDFATLSQWADAQGVDGMTRKDMAYDLRGQLDKVTVYASLNVDRSGKADGTQSVTDYIYNPDGTLHSVIDATLGQTVYAYDGLGRVISAQDAMGRTTLTSYDDAGGKVTVLLVNGLSTTSAYDRAGRLVSRVQSTSGNSNLGTTLYAYDAAGRLVRTTDPTGVRTFVLYDAQGRRAGDVDGDGSLTEYRYDIADRLVQTLQYATAVDASKLVTALGAPLCPSIAGVLPPAHADDRSTSRSYDAAGRLASTTDGEQALVTYTYDAASRLVETREHGDAGTADDRVTRHFHDADGLLLATLDAEGFLVERSYDAGGRLFRTRAYSTATAVGLRAAGTLADLRPATDDAKDAVTVYLHNAKGELAAEIDATGGLTRYTRDLAGRQTGTIRYATRINAPGNLDSLDDLAFPLADPQDRTTSCEYNALGQCTREVNEEGTVTTHQYDAATGLLRFTTVAAGTVAARTTELRYDVQGRLTGELAGQAYLSNLGLTHTYDAAGRRTSTTDVFNKKTLFFYDRDGRLTHTVNALGEVTEVHYDVLGNRDSETRYGTRVSLIGVAGGLNDGISAIVDKNDIKNSKTAFGYSHTGQLTSITDPLNVLTQIVRNAFGEEKQRTEAAGNASNAVTTTFTRDRRGLETGRVQDAGAGRKNIATSATYDAFGRLATSTDGNGNERKVDYDRMGHVVRTTDSLNRSQQTAYDVFGRVVTQTDALLRQTKYTYNAANHSMTLETPEGVQIMTAYNAFGQVVEMEDARGTTTFTYDKDGHLTNEVRGGVEFIKRQHDAGGRLQYETDAKGMRVKFEYDAVGRVFKRIVDDTGFAITTEYTYDAQGRTFTVKDPNGSVTEFTYFKDGHLQKQVADKGGLNLATQYEYDELGNTVKVTAPSLDVTKYVYDKLGQRTEEITDFGGLALTRKYAYDKNGNVVHATDANGNVTRYVYDAENRQTYSVDAAGGVRQTDYDAAGRVSRSVVYTKAVALSLANTAPSSTDVQNALSAAQATASKLEENRVYDKDGRLTATVNGLGEVVTYKYDENGNVVERRAYAKRLAGWTPGAAVQPQQDVTDQWVRTDYDDYNRAVYTVDSVGAVTTTSYDDNGNVVLRVAYATKLSAPAGRDASDRTLPAETTSDSRLRNVYDSANRLTRQVDGMGGVRAFTYDDNGNLVDSTSYATVLTGSALAQAWNLNQTPALPAADKAQDAHEVMTYDAANRLQTSAVAQGLQGGALKWTLTLFSYDANGNLLSRVTRATALGSLASGQPNLATDVPGGADRIERMAYDKANRMVFHVDGLNTVTRRLYDANGNETERRVYATTQFAGAFTASSTPATASGDRTSRTIYDASSRIKFQIDATGAVTENSYDGAGNLVTVRRHAQIVAAGATPAASTNVNDRVTLQAFDGAGRATHTLDAGGFATRTTYDGLGQVTQTIAYAGTRDAGNFTSVGDAVEADRVNRFVYDAAGNLTKTTDPLERAESYEYDGAGRKTSFTNKLGNVWTYAYDAAGRMTLETSPAVAVIMVGGVSGVPLAGPPEVIPLLTKLNYDAFGNVKSRTEALGRPEERTTSYEYDAAGRQIRTIFPQVNVHGLGNVQPYSEVTYDALGNAVANRDVGGKYSYKLMDTAGRVLFEVDTLGYVTGYARNAFGEVTQLTRYADKATTSGTAVPPTLTGLQPVTGTNNPLNRAVTTEYDALGRVTKVIEPAVYSFDPANVMSGNGAFTASKVTQTTFNAFGDVLKQGVSAMSGATASTVAAESYFRYDKLGRQVVQIVTSSRAPNASSATGYFTALEYDLAGNVMKKTEFGSALDIPEVDWSSVTGMGTAAPGGATRVTQYEYDENNNKTSETRLGLTIGTDAEGHTVTGSAVTSYAYDAVGNLVKTLDAGGLATYTYYDALGRTTAVATVSEPKVREQVAQLFLALLGRAPATQDYDDRLGAAAYAPQDMAYQIYRSPEAAARRAGTTANLIEYVYQNLAGRPADAGAINYWIGTMNGQTGDVAHAKLVVDLIAGFSNGMGIDAVVMNTRVAAAMAAPGSASAIESADDAAKSRYAIARLYVAMFGRAPDPAGLATYTASYSAKLDNADHDQLADIAQLFFQSPEGQNYYSIDGVGGARNEVEVVARLFQNIHSRSPTTSELNQWLERRRDGLAELPPQTLGRFAIEMLYSLANMSSVQIASSQAATTSLFLLDKKAGAGLLESFNRHAGATPLTTFGLDVFGNAVRRRDYATGTLFATIVRDELTPDRLLYGKEDSANDRVSYSVFDSHGRVTRAFDANGKSVSLAYDAYGNLRNESRVVSGETLTTIRTYDDAGRVTSIQGPEVLQELAYNAFGEVTLTKIAGVDYEKFEYDNAGRVWRTNQGDGIDKIRLYDVFGRQTADIRTLSTTKSINAYATASEAATASGLVRTETWYDLMGRAIKQVMPVQTVSDIGGASAPVTAQAAFVNMSTGVNQGQIRLNWMSLAGLGSGDVRVELSSLAAVTDEFGNTSLQPVTASQIFSADNALTGVDFNWAGNPLGENYAVKVWKRDAKGEWVPLIDQPAPAGYSGTPAAQLGTYATWLKIDMPGDLAITMKLQYRLAGSSGAFADAPAEQMRNFGDTQLFDASSLTEAGYEYRVVRGQSGAADVVVDQGVFASVRPKLRADMTGLYLALLNRLPDASGFDFHMDAAQAAGGSIEAEAQAFFQSTECQTEFAAGGAYSPNPGQVLNAAAFVKRFYLNTTGRVITDNGDGTLGDLTAERWRAQLAATDKSTWGSTIVAMLGSIISYAGVNAAVQGGQTVYNNKVAVGLAYVAAGGYPKDATDTTPKTLAALAASSVSAAMAGVNVAIARRNIAQLYVAVFNRAPEAAGFNDGVTSLTRTSPAPLTLTQVADNFYNSPEAKAAGLYWGAGGATLTNDDFVKQFYKVALGRPNVTSGELAKWSGQLAEGQSRGAVLLNMIDNAVNYGGTDSTMFTARQLFNNKAAVALAYAYDIGGSNYAAEVQLIANVTAAPTALVAAQAAVAAMNADAPAAIAASTNTTLAAKSTPLEEYRKEVAKLYVVLFNRAPDNTGINTWVAALSNRTSPSSLTQVFDAMMNSSEANALRAKSNADFVTAIYTNAFGVATSIAQRDAWVATMVSPKTRADITQDIINSVIGYTGTDATTKSRQNLFNNKVAVALTYAVDMAGKDLATEISLMQLVTDTSTATAMGVAINQITGTLTPGPNATVTAVDTADTKAMYDLAAVNKYVTAATLRATADGKVTTVDSQRYTTVALLYLAAMNRPGAYEAELKYYVTMMQGGTTEDQVAALLLNDSGARAIYPIGTSHADNVQFARQVYWTVFGRNPDDDLTGVNYWAAQMDGGRTHGNVLLAMTRALLNFSGVGATPVAAAAELQHKVDFRQKLANELAAAVTASGNASSISTASAETAADLAADKADVTAANAAVTAEQQSYPLESQRYTQVMQLYQAAFNRGEGISAVNLYYDQLVGGQMLEQIAQTFLASDEAKFGVPGVNGGVAFYPTSQSVDNFIHRVYLNVFNREADGEGLTYWRAKINTNNWSRGKVMVGIMNSMINYGDRNKDELTSKATFFQKVDTALSSLETSARAAADPLTLYRAAVTATTTAAKNAAATYDAPEASAAAGAAAQVRLLTVRLYTLLFNRAPDLPTLNTWAGSGKAPLQIATELLATPEGLALYPTSQSNATFWDKLFQTSLGRLPTNLEPAPSGSKAQIVVDLAASVSSYYGPEGALIGSRNLFNGKVMLALSGLAASAKVYADAAADAALVATKPLADLMIKSAWSASITGAVALASEQPSVARTFDRWGNLTKVIDQRGAITEYEYNSFDKVTKFTDALNNKTEFMYDRMGRDVAIKDARGAVNGKVYDAMGNVVAELHADGGTVSTRFSAFGERVLEREADGRMTAYGYDKMGRLLSATQAAGTKMAAYYSYGLTNGHAATELLTDLGHTDGMWDLTETYAYDELGRKVLTVAVDGIETRVKYDKRGNVIETDFSGRITTYKYNAWGFKTEQIDAVGAQNATQTWDAANMWGRAMFSVDTSGKGTYFQYNTLGQLVQQTADRRSDVASAQNLTYTYDPTSGLLVMIEDKSRTDNRVQVTQYAYDAAGNRLREKTYLRDPGNVETDVLQDNHIAYDALGRIDTINDSRYSVDYDYDANGNRIHVKTTWRTPTWRVGTPELPAGLTGEDDLTKVESWNLYDVMNRQTIVDGIEVDNIVNGQVIGKRVDIGHDGAAQGQQIAYDSAGNRRFVRQWGKRLSSTLNPSPKGLPATTTWSTVDGYVRESYGYDAAGRITDTWRDGVDGEAIRYDRAGRVVQTAVAGTAVTQSLRNAMTAAGVTPDTQYNGYDQHGQLVWQTLMDTPSSVKTLLVNQYNALGQLTRYEQHVVPNQNGNYKAEYTLAYEAWDTGKVQSIHATRDGGLPADTGNIYDANGHLVEVTASDPARSTNAANARKLLNDANGRVLRKEQDNHITHTLIANGEVIGSSSDSGAPVTETFRSSFVPTTSSTLVSGPQAYTLQQGDTYQSIAKAMWGDANLWWAIADVNSNTGLVAGDVITIPTKPNTVYNDFQVFKPYDPSEAIGDTTPVLPTPKPKKKNWLAQLVMIVVAIVAAYFIGPAALAMLESAIGPGLVATVGAGAITGAAASLISQGVGIAIGAQESFSWKGVALGAISGGVAAGIGGVDFTGGGASSVGNRVIQAAVGNTLTQGIGVVTGLQNKFDWRGVAASAAGAGVGHTVGESLGLLDSNGIKTNAFKDDLGQNLWRSAATGFAAGTAAAIMRGGRIAIQQVAADAFGNALGSSLAEAMGPQRESIYSLASGNSGQGMRAPAGTWEAGSGDGGYDDTWRSQNLARMRSLAAETQSASGVDWGASTAMGAGPSAALPSMYPAPQLVGSGRNAQGRDYYEWDSGAVATQVLPQSVLSVRALEPMGSASGMRGLRVTGSELGDELLGGALGVGETAWKALDGTVRVAGNAVIQIGDILTLGVNHDHPFIKQAWIEQGALAHGVGRLATEPRTVAREAIQSTANNYARAELLRSQGDEFGAARINAGQTAEIAAVALGGAQAIRQTANLGASSLRGMGATDWNIRMGSPYQTNSIGAGMFRLEEIGPIRHGEVTTFQDFKDRSVIGDMIEGHELWQHANLRANGLATTRLSTEASRNNPVLALEQGVHREINAGQRAFNPVLQTPVENIRTNAAILRAHGGLPDATIIDAERRALEHARALGFLE
jgi:YD repeat-containing protein